MIGGNKRKQKMFPCDGFTFFSKIFKDLLGLILIDLKDRFFNNIDAGQVPGTTFHPLQFTVSVHTCILLCFSYEKSGRGQEDMRDIEIHQTRTFAPPGTSRPAAKFTAHHAGTYISRMTCIILHRLSGFSLGALALTRELL